MATTSIWGVRGGLDKVVNYATNPEKTVKPVPDTDEQALQDIATYAMNSAKTERQLFVTGINCIPAFVCDQMAETKRRWRKEGGIIAFHGYQSFVAGEVTPEQAHKIGVELAQTLWGDRFEVIVATHLNTNCLHNHFVINSVSFMDGKRYYDNKASYRRMRDTSDELCRKYRLSVIENPQYGRTQSYPAWQAQQNDQPTMRGFIRADIDAAIAMSTTAQHFWKTNY